MPSVLPDSSSPRSLHVRPQGIEPSTAHDIAVALRDAPRQGQHQSERVLRHGWGVPPGGVDDRDAVGRGGSYVNVVRGSPADPNEPEARNRLEHLLEDEVHFHHQDRGPHVAQLCRELGWVVHPSRVHPALVVDVEAAR